MEKKPKLVNPIEAFRLFIIREFHAYRKRNKLEAVFLIDGLTFNREIETPALNKFYDAYPVMRDVLVIIHEDKNGKN